MAKTITGIGRAECKTLSEEATAALQRTLNKYGITVTYGGGRYGGHTARLSFDLTVEDMAKTITGIGREELTAVIQRAVNKYGITATYSGGRYGGHTARLNFDLTVGGATAKAASDRDAEMLGAKFGIGFRFVQKGREYEVTGFNQRRPKYPVAAKRLSDGVAYKFQIEGINRQAAQGGQLMSLKQRHNEVYAIGEDGCEGSEYLHTLIDNALDTLELQGDTSDRLRQWLRSPPAIGDTLEADCGACEPITRIA